MGEQHTPGPTNTEREMACALADILGSLEAVLYLAHTSYGAKLVADDKCNRRVARARAAIAKAEANPHD